MLTKVPCISGLFTSNQLARSWKLTRQFTNKTNLQYLFYYYA